MKITRQMSFLTNHSENKSCVLAHDLTQPQGQSKQSRQCISSRLPADLASAPVTPRTVPVAPTPPATDTSEAGPRFLHGRMQGEKQGEGAFYPSPPGRATARGPLPLPTDTCHHTTQHRHSTLHCSLINRRSGSGH